MSGKYAARGVNGLVFKDMRDPLTDLSQHPDVQAVSAGKSFNPGTSKSRGLKTSIYHNNGLKINCFSVKGGQEVYAVVEQDAVERVKQYINKLNGKYFR